MQTYGRADARDGPENEEIGLSRIGTNCVVEGNKPSNVTLGGSYFI